MILRAYRGSVPRLRYVGWTHLSHFIPRDPGNLLNLPTYVVPPACTVTVATPMSNPSEQHPDGGGIDVGPFATLKPVLADFYRVSVRRQYDRLRSHPDHRHRATTTPLGTWGNVPSITPEGAYDPSHGSHHEKLYTLPPFLGVGYHAYTFRLGLDDPSVSPITHPRPSESPLALPSPLCETYVESRVRTPAMGDGVTDRSGQLYYITPMGRHPYRTPIPRVRRPSAPPYDRDGLTVRPTTAARYNPFKASSLIELSDDDRYGDHRHRSTNDSPSYVDGDPRLWGNGDKLQWCYGDRVYYARRRFGEDLSVNGVGLPGDGHGVNVRHVPTESRNGHRSPGAPTRRPGFVRVNRRMNRRKRRDHHRKRVQPSLHQSRGTQRSAPPTRGSVNRRRLAWHRRIMVRRRDFVSPDWSYTPRHAPAHGWSVPRAPVGRGRDGTISGVARKTTPKSSPKSFPERTTIPTVVRSGAPGSRYALGGLGRRLLLRYTGGSDGRGTTLRHTALAAVARRERTLLALVRRARYNVLRPIALMPILYDAQRRQLWFRYTVRARRAIKRPVYPEHRREEERPPDIARGPLIKLNRRNRLRVERWGFEFTERYRRWRRLRYHRQHRRVDGGLLAGVRCDLQRRCSVGSPGRKPRSADEPYSRRGLGSIRVALGVPVTSPTTAVLPDGRSWTADDHDQRRLPGGGSPTGVDGWRVAVPAVGSTVTSMHRLGVPPTTIAYGAPGERRGVVERTIESPISGFRMAGEHTPTVVPPLTHRIPKPPEKPVGKLTYRKDLLTRLPLRDPGEENTYRIEGVKETEYGTYVKREVDDAPRFPSVLEHVDGSQYNSSVVRRDRRTPLPLFMRPGNRSQPADQSPCDPPLGDPPTREEEPSDEWVSYLETTRPTPPETDRVRIVRRRDDRRNAALVAALIDRNRPRQEPTTVIKTNPHIRREPVVLPVLARNLKSRWRPRHPLASRAYARRLRSGLVACILRQAVYPRRAMAPPITTGLHRWSTPTAGLANGYDDRFAVRHDGNPINGGPPRHGYRASFLPDRSTRNDGVLRRAPGHRDRDRWWSTNLDGKSHRRGVFRACWHDAFATSYPPRGTTSGWVRNGVAYDGAVAASYAYLMAIQRPKRSLTRGQRFEFGPTEIVSRMVATVMDRFSVEPAWQAGAGRSSERIGLKRGAFAAGNPLRGSRRWAHDLRRFSVVANQHHFDYSPACVPLRRYLVRNDRVNVARRVTRKRPYRDRAIRGWARLLHTRAYGSGSGSAFGKNPGVGVMTGSPGVKPTRGTNLRRGGSPGRSGVGSPASSRGAPRYGVGARGIAGLREQAVRRDRAYRHNRIKERRRRRRERNRKLRKNPGRVTWPPVRRYLNVHHPKTAWLRPTWLSLYVPNEPTSHHRRHHRMRRMLRGLEHHLKSDGRTIVDRNAVLPDLYTLPQAGDVAVIHDWMTPLPRSRDRITAPYVALGLTYPTSATGSNVVQMALDQHAVYGRSLRRVWRERVRSLEAVAQLSQITRRHSADGILPDDQRYARNTAWYVPPQVFDPEPGDLTDNYHVTDALFHQRLGFHPRPVTGRPRYTGTSGTKADDTRTHRSLTPMATLWGAYVDTVFATPAITEIDDDPDPEDEPYASPPGEATSVVFARWYDTDLAYRKGQAYRTHGARALEALRPFIRTHASPGWMALRVLSVSPPDTRPMVELETGQMVVSDLNKFYQQILSTRRQQVITQRNRIDYAPPPAPDDFDPGRRNYHYYSNRLGVEAPERLDQDRMQSAVDNLMENGKAGAEPLLASNLRQLKSLSDNLKGKKGRFRQNLLGKRVDYSGRSVIVVGPSLRVHECGLPLEMALVLFQNHLIRDLLRTGMKRPARGTRSRRANHIYGWYGAKRMVQQKHPVVLRHLRRLIDSQPLLLNRAPTLHRLGIQAFVGRLVSGRAILLHPLVCSAFNADFDGDQMAVHMPLTASSSAEAWTLMWSCNHVRSVATGEALLLPSQDIVLGCYALTMPDRLNRWKILARRGDDGVLRRAPGSSGNIRPYDVGSPPGQPRSPGSSLSAVPQHSLGDRVVARDDDDSTHRVTWLRATRYELEKPQVCFELQLHTSGVINAYSPELRVRRTPETPANRGRHRDVLIKTTVGRVVAHRNFVPPRTGF